MYKIFALIALIAFFLFKQSHDSKIDTKTYKVEFENKLEFNAQHLQAVIADVWNINN
jgi:hypothetical protein